MNSANRAYVQFESPYKLFEAPLISSQLKSIILGLESRSDHPIAISLRQIWVNIPTAQVQNVKEISGYGVEANFENHFYQFHKDAEDLHSSLYKDGKKILSLSFVKNY